MKPTPPLGTVLCSDAHLDGPDDPIQARFLEFLEHLEADRLVLVGDVFHRWWTRHSVPHQPGSSVFPAYRPVVEALARRAQRTEIVMVHGNHDFALAALPGIAHIGPLHVECHETRHVLLTHGDEIDTRPGPRLLRKVLRSRLFHEMLLRLPDEAAWSLLGRLAGPAPRRPPHPDRLPSVLRDHAARSIPSRADIVVHGHVHVPEVTRTNGGLYVNLGAFYLGHWWTLRDGILTREDSGEQWNLQACEAEKRPFNPDVPEDARGHRAKLSARLTDHSKTPAFDPEVPSW